MGPVEPKAHGLMKTGVKHQLMKAREIQKMIAQGKIEEIEGTLRWMKNKKEGIPDEVYKLKKKETKMTLKRLLDAIKLFSRPEEEPVLHKVVRDVEQKLEEDDIDGVLKAIRSFKTPTVRNDIERALRKWVLKNVDDIEEVVKDEIRARYEIPKNVEIIVGMHPSATRKEAVTNYSQGSILPRRDTWLYIVEKLTKGIVDIRGRSKGEKVRRIHEYIRRNRVLKDAVRLAEKAVKAMEEGRDIVFVDPIGHDRSLILSGEANQSNSEEIYVYSDLADGYVHEIGHARGFNIERRINGEYKYPRSMGEGVYRGVLEEAIAYMREMEKKPHLKAFDLGGGPDSEHKLGWEIARLADKLGLTVEDLARGAKNKETAKEMIKQIIEKTRQIDGRRAKKLERWLSEIVG